MQSPSNLLRFNQHDAKWRRSYLKEFPKESCPTQREIIKEGIVNYISIDSSTFDTKRKWEKCRLVLVKSTDASLLEFYTPLKSFKPKCGLFCFLIDEARATKPLESMPDREFTFVLKVDIVQFFHWCPSNRALSPLVVQSDGVHH